MPPMKLLLHTHETTTERTIINAAATAAEAVDKK
jgi:hypothetical protein